MKRYIVIASPKIKYRQGLNVLIKVVQSEDAKQAIDVANLQTNAEYNKPVVRLCAFNELFQA